MNQYVNDGRNVVGIIPARMGSSRFPGKPLEEIRGVPMVGHVMHRSMMAESLDEVFVATCDEVIRDYVLEAGGSAIMTKDTHERASDRTAEAMKKIEEHDDREVDIVVMIQGDEPMLRPGMIDEALEPMFNDESLRVVNLMGPISGDEYDDVNEVKVVVDQNNFALYFSREPIPTKKMDRPDYQKWKQVCIIPFRREFLIEFNDMESTPLEQVESIDMLRVIENDYRVKMVPTEFRVQSVDTAEERQVVEELMEDDPLLPQYS